MIEIGDGVVFRQEDFCSHMDAGTTDVHKSRVFMDGEDFSTGQVFDSVAGVGGNIVKYMVDVCIGGFSCDSLFTSN